MKAHPGVAADLFDALAAEGINIEMISTSPIRISCVIRRGRGRARVAVRCIRRFELDREEPGAPTNAVDGTCRRDTRRHGTRSPCRSLLLRFPEASRGAESGVEATASAAPLVVGSSSVVAWRGNVVVLSVRGRPARPIARTRTSARSGSATASRAGRLASGRGRSNSRSHLPTSSSGRTATPTLYVQADRDPAGRRRSPSTSGVRQADERHAVREAIRSGSRGRRGAVRRGGGRDPRIVRARCADRGVRDATASCGGSSSPRTRPTRSTSTWSDSGSDARGPGSSAEAAPGPSAPGTVTSMKVAVVGATGAVGREMTRILEERRFPVDEFLPLASSRSRGARASASAGRSTRCASSPSTRSAGWTWRWSRPVRTSLGRSSGRRPRRSTLHRQLQRVPDGRGRAARRSPR